jgi:hypothetical protein
MNTIPWNFTHSVMFSNKTQATVDTKVLISVIVRLKGFNINGRREVNVYRRIRSLTSIVLFTYDLNEK